MIARAPGVGGDQRAFCGIDQQVGTEPATLVIGVDRELS